MRKIIGKLTPEIIKSQGKDYEKGINPIPFKVNTYRELVEHIAKLSYLNKDHLIFYRGQNTDHSNNNGNSTFYPSIYRAKRLSQAELSYRFDKLESASKQLVNELEKNNIEGVQELKRKKLLQWSIIQHYEICGTPLMDFTQSLRVACSFANLENKKSKAYIFVFGLPYLTNRISVNSEHDLTNIRLLSICPPEALRPYFQEGYVVCTDDITDDYDNKHELDFSNRLIAKFEIPNTKSFWGDDFNEIPKSALYPDNDLVENLCEKIKVNIDKFLSPGDMGVFLSEWSDIESILQYHIEDENDKMHNAATTIKILYNQGIISKEMRINLDQLRKYRNSIIHKPKLININDLSQSISDAKKLKEELYGIEIKI